MWQLRRVCALCNRGVKCWSVCVVYDLLWNNFRVDSTCLLVYFCARHCLASLQMPTTRASIARQMSLVSTIALNIIHRGYLSVT